MKEWVPSFLILFCGVISVALVREFVHNLEILNQGYVYLYPEGFQQL